MNNDVIFASAQAYWSEGLNVIPVRFKAKNPALGEWKEYQTRQSTKQEIKEWFGNGTLYNIGIVHGKMRDNFGYYGTFDIDHDVEIYERMREEFPTLFEGRIERTGSGEGYHIPIITVEQVAWGSKTWKIGKQIGTSKRWYDSVNFRAAIRQTVVPPSVHPSGNLYEFLQSGDITRAQNLDNVFAWLNQISKKPHDLKPKRTKRAIQPPQDGTLLQQVLAYWRPEKVFDHFGLVSQIQEERNGEVRLLGNGGLLIKNDKVWFCHEEQIGGGGIEAWVWCKGRIGQTLDKKAEFRKILIQMAEAGGIDLTGFYRLGDEGHLNAQKNKRTRTTRKEFSKLRRPRQD